MNTRDGDRSRRVEQPQVTGRGGSQTFDEFMADVDRELGRICGLGHRDLADFAYYDAYDDECDPKEVALSVLQDNDFPFTDE